MNEIEMAIKSFEKFKEMGYSHSNLPSSWSIELALAALREKQERGGCEFCQKPYKSIDSGKDGKEKSILYMGGNSAYAEVNKKYLHFMDAAGRMDLFEVAFCPSCGKRLEGKP